MKEISFWIAVGLAGALTVGALKIAGPRLPTGAQRLIASL